MTIQYVNSFLTKIQRHPLWVGFGVAVILIAWVGLLGYTYVLSPSPSEAEIAQQTIRFNQAGFGEVTNLTVKYRQSFELPDLPKDLFSSAP